MSIQKFFVLFILIILTLIQTSYAIEVAPRISDREIIDHHFISLEGLLIIGIIGVYGLIAYLFFDKRIELRTIETRMDLLSKDLQHDLELRHEKGSLLTRLVQSLQELAKHDEKLANVLRNYSLL